MSRAPLQPPSNPRQHVGKTIARCVVGEPLGYGRTSGVYRAHYEPLGRDIALKVMAGEFSGTDDMRDRFIAEARAIAQVEHANVVRVYDVVEDDEHEVCILMELVSGETLHELIKRDGALPVKKALRIALEIAQALEAAHEAGVVHRDVKPPNVMLERGTGLVKVLDFGLAGGATTTRIGTPLYMSPEACQGKRIDEKSDVYALGICIYKMLTGELPYTGGTVKEILAAHVKADLILPSVVKPDLGSDYDDIVKKLLVSAKGYRPTSAEAVEMLAPFVETRAQQTSGKGGKRKRRSRAAAKSSSNAPMIAGVIGLIVVAAIAAVFLLKGKGDETDTGAVPPDVVNPPPPRHGGGVRAGNGDTATPPVPKVDPKIAAAKVAYENAVAWVANNKRDYAGAVKKWEQVATDHTGTEWGLKAGDDLKGAKRRAAQAEADAVRAKERAAVDDRVNNERKALLEAIGRYDFGAAKGIASKHSKIEGESFQDWRKKSTRIDYLSVEFTKRLNAGFEANQIMAVVVKKDAGHDEVLVSADEKGLSSKAGDLPRRIEWTTVGAEAVWKLFKKFTSIRRVDENVFLAVLARELGLSEQAQEHAVTATIVDAMGDAKDKLRRFFVDPDDASK